MIIFTILNIIMRICEFVILGAVLIYIAESDFSISDIKNKFKELSKSA